MPELWPGKFIFSPGIINQLWAGGDNALPEQKAGVYLWRWWDFVVKAPQHWNSRSEILFFKSLFTLAFLLLNIFSVKIVESNLSPGFEPCSKKVWFYFIHFFFFEVILHRSDIFSGQEKVESAAFTEYSHRTQKPTLMRCQWTFLPSSSNMSLCFISCSLNELSFIAAAFLTPQISRKKRLDS